MKDIATVCSQDVAVDEVSVLSPSHPQNVDFVNACHPDISCHHYDSSGYLYSQPSGTCCEKFPSLLSCGSPPSQKVFHPLTAVSSPSNTLTSGVRSQSSPNPFCPLASVKAESSTAAIYSSASVQPKSPSNLLCPSSSAKSPSEVFYLPASVQPQSSSPVFCPPLSSVSGAPKPSASFAPAAVSFMSSHSPVPAFIPSPSLSMLSHTPSPSASFTSSPSIGSPSATLTPLPASPVLSPVSPLSPPVTIKTEVDASPCMSSGSPQPQCQPQQAVGTATQGLTPRPCPMRSTSPGKTVSGSLLPPCKICLDKASGFHYGLNTCEACKGFFRRSLKRGVSYVCARSGNCDVTGEKRNMCGYCRYQKCIALGMSKKAIKTGRYTHAKRTKDTLEIKRLMGEESVAEEEDDLDFEALIAQVVKAHDDFVISSTKVSPSAILSKQIAKVDEVNLHMKHFGKMTEVSPDEHQEIFNMTGIDIDNRRELMRFHVRNSERWIRGYISFAKKLPGFRELSLSDQANLVKYARIEFWFLGSFPGYNSELGVAVMPNGRCFTRREMCNVWKTKYIDVSFDLAQKLQKLQVTPEEMILVKAICLTAGDRCSFEDPDKVARIQWKMIRCLQNQLKKRCSSHREFVSIFSKVFMCLTDLRDLNEAEYQTIQSTQLYELFTAHPLIMEMLPY